jgi:hypothetical protein
MADEVKKPNPFARPAPGGPGMAKPGGVKAVPGPTLRESGGTIPCGCKVAHDPDDNKLRYWFCPPHAVAYEMLEVLQAVQPALDDLVNNAKDEFDTTGAMEAGIKLRRVLKRAKGDWR